MQTIFVIVVAAIAGVVLAHTRFGESVFAVGGNERAATFAGINTMAPPLAGSINMSYIDFIRYDLSGASLYLLTYGTVGFVFSSFLGAITRGLMTVGHGIEWVVLTAILVYIGYRIYLFCKHRVYRVGPRVQVEELAKKLEADAQNILIVDVRSHGYYDADSYRIQGSIRLEPNHLATDVGDLPKDKQIYLPLASL